MLGSILGERHAELPIPWTLPYGPEVAPASTCIKWSTICFWHWSVASWLRRPQTNKTAISAREGRMLLQMRVNTSWGTSVTACPPVWSCRARLNTVRDHFKCVTSEATCFAVEDLIMFHNQWDSTIAVWFGGECKYVWWSSLMLA